MFLYLHCIFMGAYFCEMKTVSTTHSQTFDLTKLNFCASILAARVLAVICFLMYRQFFFLLLMDWMFRTTCCYFHLSDSYFLLPLLLLVPNSFFSASISFHILLLRPTEWIFIMHFSINLLKKFIYGSSSTFNVKNSIAFFTSTSHKFSSFLLFRKRNVGHAQ